jgi:hypothetical protein
VLLAGIVVGLVVGLLLGGRLDNLLEIRLRWAPAIILSVVIGFGTEVAIREGVALADQLRLPLYALSIGRLFAAHWLNRDQPGLPGPSFAIFSPTPTGESTCASSQARTPRRHGWQSSASDGWFRRHA